MLRHVYRLAALSVGVAVWMAVLEGTARASSTLQECMDEAVNHDGEPPTCTKVNGEWVATWPGDDSSSGGNGVAIVVLLLMGILVAVGVLAWKVSTANKLARQSGMDPSLATQMTLLTDDGLEATYLAANLRPTKATEPASDLASPSVPAPTTRSVAERLSELGELHQQGIITQAEYDERRKVIIDQV